MLTALLASLRMTPQTPEPALPTADPAWMRRQPWRVEYLEGLLRPAEAAPQASEGPSLSEWVRSSRPLCCPRYVRSLPR